jgi:hypothetical protein
MEIKMPSIALTLPRRIRVALLLLGLGACVAEAQQYTPPPPPLVQGPCVPTKKDNCLVAPDTAPSAAKDKFPFSVEPGAGTSSIPVQPSAAKSFPFPDDVEKPKSPASAPTSFPFPVEPGAGTSSIPVQPSAAKSFPFPDDVEKPKSPASAPTSFPFPPDADQASPSSSSSSSSSTSATGASDPTPDATEPVLADKGSTGTTRAQRRHLPKVEDLEEREAKDLEVSRYYASTGNFVASYLRAQDAVKLFPDDPAAHFALAEGARSLRKTEEAVAEYRLYLALDPGGEKAKTAERNVSELTRR